MTVADVRSPFVPDPKIPVDELFQVREIRGVVLVEELLTSLGIEGFVDATHR